MINYQRRKQNLAVCPGVGGASWPAGPGDTGLALHSSLLSRGPLFGPSLQRGYVSPNLPCSSDPHFTDRVRRPRGRTWEGKYQDPAISCLVDSILYLNTFRNVSLFI